MRKKVLVLVKTYPVISRKYGELVCTAGIDEEGNWIRLYPMPVSLFEDKELKKYRWIELDVEKRAAYKDNRPESWVPQRQENICYGDIVGSRDGWVRRRRLIFDKVKVVETRAELLSLSEMNKQTLAVFKPAKILNVTLTPQETTYSEKELAQIQEFVSTNCEDLFKQTGRDPQEFIPKEKLPFRLKYEFEDAQGEPLGMHVIDWEVGALWYNSYKHLPFEEYKEKILGNYRKRPGYDIYFYMGTMWEWMRRKAPDPWTIVGVAQVPEVVQEEFDLMGL